MNRVISVLIEYVIVYILVFCLYYFLFVRKKTKYDKNKVPVEFYYLVSLYKLEQDKINYKKFMYATAFINTFIISTTYIIIVTLLNKLIWQIIVGLIVLVLLIIVCYGMLGRHYQKKNKDFVDVSVKKIKKKKNIK